MSRAAHTPSDALSKHLKKHARARKLDLKKSIEVVAQSLGEHAVGIAPVETFDEQNLTNLRLLVSRIAERRPLAEDDEDHYTMLIRDAEYFIGIRQQWLDLVKEHGSESAASRALNRQHYKQTRLLQKTA